MVRGRRAPRAPPLRRDRPSSRRRGSGRVRAPRSCSALLLQLHFRLGEADVERGDVAIAVALAPPPPSPPRGRPPASCSVFLFHLPSRRGGADVERGDVAIAVALAAPLDLRRAARTGDGH